jgi:hypothetical protein
MDGRAFCATFQRPEKNFGSDVVEMEQSNSGQNSGQAIGDLTAHLRDTANAMNRAKLIESQAHAKTMKFIESMDEFWKGGGSL